MAAPASSLPEFGRKWQLQILTAPENGSQVVWTIGQDAWLPESLRVTFDVNKNAYKALWWADISIYNLNLATQEAVILEGYEVILSAGYQNGSNYGIFFQGRVFQVLWTREDVVDYRLTLHCMVGLEQLVDNMVSCYAIAGTSQRDIILRMAEQAQTPINISQLDTATLGTKILPRGEVIFGSPYKYLSEVANSNGLQFFNSSSGVTLADITPKDPSPQYIYSAVPNPASDVGRVAGVSYTVIGTPQQIPEGVIMRVLGDARLDVLAPCVVIKLDNTVVRQMGISPPNLAPILAQDGVYGVATVRHSGDTRENDWYTDVTCITLIGGILGVLGLEASLRGQG